MYKSDKKKKKCLEKQKELLVSLSSSVGDTLHRNCYCFDSSFALFSPFFFLFQFVTLDSSKHIDAAFPLHSMDDGSLFVLIYHTEGITKITQAHHTPDPLRHVHSRC